MVERTESGAETTAMLSIDHYQHMRKLGYRSLKLHEIAHNLFKLSTETGLELHTPHSSMDSSL